MSSNVFPSLPIKQKESRRTPYYETTVRRTASRREQRWAWDDTPLYRYSLRFTLRKATASPPPWQAYSERDIVQKFFDDHRGSWDSFFFVDPWDNVQRTVRFADDDLEFVEILPGLYEVQIDLESVK